MGSNPTRVTMRDGEGEVIIYSLDLEDQHTAEEVHCKEIERIPIPNIYLVYILLKTPELRRIPDQGV